MITPCESYVFDAEFNQLMAPICILKMFWRLFGSILIRPFYATNLSLLSDKINFAMLSNRQSSNLKILQQSVSEHFTTLRSKGLT